MKKVLLFVVIFTLFFSFSAVVFASSGITKSAAINKALADAKVTRTKVKALECELEKEKYEVEFTKKSNSADYEYKISKSTGNILKKEVEYVYKHNSSKTKIWKEKAREKVAKFSGFKLSTVKNGTCEYEYDDNEGVYEVKFKTSKYKYEYDVLAPTGKIIEYTRVLR